MRHNLLKVGSRRGGLLPLWQVALLGSILILASSSAIADVIHLKSGGRIEGTITQQDSDSLTVRTLVGTVTVPRDTVERIEEKPSVLDEYVRRKEKAPDTPEAQVALAEWCEEHEITSAWRVHMKRAIELDTNCAAARKALGYVRVGGLWVEARAGDNQAADAEAEAEAAEKQPDAEQLAAAIQTQWMIQLRAIRNNKLNAASADTVREGRRKIEQIQDPLAILPLVRVLSAGSVAAREALVSALSRFPQDEATMNLAVLALVDPAPKIRHSALVELQRRNDPRVVVQFCQALRSDNDGLVRRAAVALGTLKVESTVPDLIRSLKVQRRKRVEVMAAQYFQYYPNAFDRPTVFYSHGSTLLSHRPAIGIDPARAVVLVDSEYAVRNVTVLRSEVREALRNITGKDFGFEEEAWRRWYEEQEP